MRVWTEPNGKQEETGLIEGERDGVRAFLWKEESEAWAAFPNDIWDRLRPATEETTNRTIEKFTAWKERRSLYAEWDEDLEDDLIEIQEAKSREADSCEGEDEETESDVEEHTVQALVRRALEKVKALEINVIQSRTERDKWKENHDRMFRVWTAMMQEKEKGATPPDPRNGWCKAMTENGTRCVEDAAEDNLCVKHWRLREAGGKTYRHPAEEWCIARNQDGKRCLNNTHADHLCTKHWRERERARTPL